MAATTSKTLQKPLKGSNIQTADVSLELRNFISLVTNNKTTKNNTQELTRRALHLLKTLPSARDAVFEFFCSLFDSAAATFIMNLEKEAMSTNKSENSPSPEETNILEIHSILSQLISSNPEAWAPIISAWTLELLGKISSMNSHRIRVPIGSGLHETVQLWMSCQATKTLIEITTHCFSCLMHSNTDACVNALLDTSIRHCPHFDWVVAHIAGCFPRMVITRVLSCGLKDFCVHGQFVKGSQQNTLGPKLQSVVGILGHLALTHSADIKGAVLDLFQISLVQRGAQQLATVPFLLHLASMSTVLRQALTTSVLPVLTLDIVNQISDQVPVWIDQYFGSEKTLISLVVHLTLNSDEGGDKVLILLLKLSENKSAVMQDDVIRKTARRLIYNLLQEIIILCNNVTRQRVDEIPVLNSLAKFLPTIQPYLVSHDSFQSYCVWKLLPLLASYHGLNVLVNTMDFFLTNTDIKKHITIFVKLLRSIELTCPNMLSESISHSLKVMFISDKSVKVKLRDFLCNIEFLLCWERKRNVKRVFLRSYITRAVGDSLELFVHHLRNEDTAYNTARIILMAEFPLNSKRNVLLMTKMCRRAIEYFFRTLQKPYSMGKLTECKVSKQLLTLLCQHNVTQTLNIRLLVQNVLSENYSELCGGKYDNMVVTTEINYFRQNQKHGLTVSMPQHHSSVFHAGIIGNGPRKKLKMVKNSYNDMCANTKVFLTTLSACCDLIANGSTNNGNGFEPMTVVSLLLVELISPDVMFNGLPWPDEDFTRVTIERDLHIRRMFEQYPILWGILRILALKCPSLCYCSVLLRAVMATLISFWSTNQDRKSTNSPMQLNVTVDLLHLMTVAHILPPPFSCIPETLQYLAPYEITWVLKDTWNYMRDNVPAPSLYAKDNAGNIWRDFHTFKIDIQYRERLRLVLLSHVSEVGEFYTHFFHDG